MTDMTEGWDGVERRTVPSPPSTTAQVGDVRLELGKLRVAFEQLAKAMDPGKIDEGVSAIRRQIVLSIVTMVITIVVLMVFSLAQVNRIVSRLDAGHQSINCLLLLPAEARTHQSILNCLEAK